MSTTATERPPPEGYSVGVIYDPDGRSKLVIDMQATPVAPGVDRDAATARHERAPAWMQDPDARAQRQDQIRAAQEPAQAQGAMTLRNAATVQEMIANAYARAGTHAPGSDVADELTRLADLRDRGVLTDAEFQAQKAKILGAT